MGLNFFLLSFDFGVKYGLALYLTDSFYSNLILEITVYYKSVQEFLCFYHCNYFDVHAL